MTCAGRRRSFAAAHDLLEDVDAPLKRLRLNGAAPAQGWPPGAAQFGAPPPPLPPPPPPHAQPVVREQLRESFPDLIEEEEEVGGADDGDGRMGDGGDASDSGSGSASSDDGGRRRRGCRGFKVLLPGGVAALPPLPGFPARGGAGGGFRVEELLAAPAPTSDLYHSQALVPYIPRGVPAAPRFEEVEEEDTDGGMALDAPAPARVASGDMDLD
jgi:hypothetical protein